MKGKPLNRQYIGRSFDRSKCKILQARATPALKPGSETWFSIPVLKPRLTGNR
jgi:hypothetical protein